MSKAKKQGTEWERELVSRFTSYPIRVTRLAEGGMNDLGDILVENDTRGDGIHNGAEPVAALVWKRLVPAEGKKRRQPMGERAVVVLPLDAGLDALWLLAQVLNRAVVVEAKATQSLSVTTALAKARSKVEHWVRRNR